MQQNASFYGVATAEAVQRKQFAAAAASVTVNTVIDEAVVWILSDPSECFLYKYPCECKERRHNRLQLARIAAMEINGASTSAKEQRNSIRAVTKANLRKRINWLRIDEFSLPRVVQLVYDYLSLWRLTPNTHYMVRPEQDAVCVQPQGRTYCLSVVFTRKPQRDMEHCNPLTMAQANFKVHASHFLPKFYPVMMTYRFENCKTDYYALGNRRMRRLDFQRFFIDMALETKLGFYAQFLKTIAFSTSNKCLFRRGSKREDRKKEIEASAKRLCICEAENSTREGNESSSEREQVAQEVNVSVDECTKRMNGDTRMENSCDFRSSDHTTPELNSENEKEKAGSSEEQACATG
ncbi:uncharacterized protein LOC128856765 [Anastrepha ludens]|uniref:uncharacterized protein LOC128856765 n=1 Tax=Anastrepha ludens TaxID=28586 RepID=UPI0023B082B3|nr:uncharacterized protein LOC128856765 [Anastrepha ludens]